MKKMREHSMKEIELVAGDTSQRSQLALLNDEKGRVQRGELSSYKLR
jgi:hypothetical protein